MYKTCGRVAGTHEGVLTLHTGREIKRKREGGGGREEEEREQHVADSSDVLALQVEKCSAPAFLRETLEGISYEMGRLVFGLFAEEFNCTSVSLEASTI